MLASTETAAYVPIKAWSKRRPGYLKGGKETARPPDLRDDLSHVKIGGRALVVLT